MPKTTTLHVALTLQYLDGAAPAAVQAVVIAELEEFLLQFRLKPFAATPVDGRPVYIVAVRPGPPVP